MAIIAGVDIGNASTETSLARIDGKNNLEFLSSAIVSTTGIKGTRQNVHGIFASLSQALKKAGLDIKDVDSISINEAAPVIGDVAMETITETIITESTMIGHNPNTPGGIGIGIGYTIPLDEILSAPNDKDYIVVIDENISFKDAAIKINKATENNFKIKGAIVKKDDGVLIHNRLENKIPIVDEVTFIHKVPIGMLAAIEVASSGRVVEVLSNPYGVATAFSLTSEETKFIVPIARALIGNRSAVVIKTPKGDVTERTIPAGKVNIIGEKIKLTVDIESGASEIMKGIYEASPITDVNGEPGTNAGGMFERVRQVLSELTDRDSKDIKIQDVLAVDTFNPQKVIGGIAEEFSMENAVGIAAMVKSDKLQMNLIASELTKQFNVPVVVGGIEADMAILGALTTPGVNKPIAIIDMGAGSTDASILTKNGNLRSVHLAGAGDMVTLLIKTELGLTSNDIAEDIKKYPLAKVESLFHIRHEDGSVQFFPEPLPANIFARTIIIKEDGFIPIPMSVSIEKVKLIRQEAKTKVFVTNALRALKMVTASGNIREIEFVVLVGGSALDFEIPQLVTDALSHYGVVAGRGNIRGVEGPRNAVATGLVIDYFEKREG